MSTTTLIAITDFCKSHDLEHTYFRALEEYGLVTIEQEQYIRHEELPVVEKILRLNQEMHINFEGIDVILNLLDKLEQAAENEQRLRKRLSIFE